MQFTLIYVMKIQVITRWVTLKSEKSFVGSLGYTKDTYYIENSENETK